MRRDYLDKWDCQLIFRDNSLIINKEKKVDLASNNKGHFIMKSIDTEIQDTKVKETFFTNCDNMELKEKLKKIHILSAHTKEETLLRFLRGLKHFNKKIKSLLSEW